MNLHFLVTQTKSPSDLTYFPPPPAIKNDRSSTRLNLHVLMCEPKTSSVPQLM